MEYTYSKNHLKNFLNNNLDSLLNDPKFQALIVEVKVAEDAGSNFVNKTGHDEVHDVKGRIETKFTNYIMPTGELRINSAGDNKRGGFDLLRIIDGINQRIFEVPHDEYFNEGNIAISKTEDYNSHNTTILDVNGVKKLLKKLPEIKNAF